MQPIPVTEAEHALMDALWRMGPLTPSRLIAEVQARRQWAPATIKTLLARLKQKGAIATEKVDGRLQYRPTFDRQTYVAWEVRDLVDRLFDGDTTRLSAYLKQKPASG